MAYYKHKSITEEAISFEELKAFARENSPYPHHKFQYKGLTFTQESDESYIFQEVNGMSRITPNHMLFTGFVGQLYAVELDLFNRNYEFVTKLK